MGLWCRGDAHDEQIGNWRSAQHRRFHATDPDEIKRLDAEVAYYAPPDDHLRIPPLADATTQLESLVSIGCGCSVNHCRLPLPKPRYKPPTDWTPQADGEGPEL